MSENSELLLVIFMVGIACVTFGLGFLLGRFSAPEAPYKGFIVDDVIFYLINNEMWRYHTKENYWTIMMDFPRKLR